MILIEELDNSVNGVNDLIVWEACGLSEVTFLLVSLFHCRKNSNKSARECRDGLVADTSYK